MPADAELARDLLRAVQAQDFGATADAERGGAALAHFPSIDLALALFAPGAAPRFANVLFSREHPGGIAAPLADDAGALVGLRYDADLQDAQGESIAWRPDADWSRLPFERLYGDGPLRVVAPYPASVLKLMVAFGIALARDRGLIAAWPHALAPMLTVSDNDATTELVRQLHRLGMIDPLHAEFGRCGLPTLRLRGTTAAGGWGNADGAGVGRIQMTAWDTLRLLWLIDGQTPQPPWLPPGSKPLRPESAAHLVELLRRQQLDGVLSSGSLRDLPGWVEGLPDAPAYAHKTGNTLNYAADAGIVQRGGGGGRYAIVVVFTNLGTRHAPQPRCASTWRLPALGGAIRSLIDAA
ncbi:MAG: serine hydrolase [Burkholderiales bacterium]|nr:serine hydrolase [Burkholderiales bacterium]MDE1928291.1 serine hydrolase [Burkholderiales bacterium]MDE2157622.1 serine hydrolase [Burkholderiales bacterium]MDE2504705.1 serine hydrolase [Burkholderiales bacterium]